MTNAVGHEHDAALRRLVTRGNIAALEARIANEPTILERLGSLDDQGVTMLHHAAEHGQVETMRWLVNRCGVLATARDVRHGTALLEAAPNGQIAAAEFLVNHGVDVNDSDARGDTALHVAAGYGQLVMMKWLVKRKALVDARTVVGVTPLHYAAAKGRTEVCKWLIAQGANIAAVEHENGGCVLHVAADCNQSETIEWIVSQNPDLLQVRNHKGKTPLDVASAQHRVDAATKLKELARAVELAQGAEAKAEIAARELVESLTQSSSQKKSKKKKKSKKQNKTGKPSDATAAAAGAKVIHDEVIAEQLGSGSTPTNQSEQNDEPSNVVGPDGTSSHDEVVHTQDETIPTRSPSTDTAPTNQSSDNDGSDASIEAGDRDGGWETVTRRRRRAQQSSTDSQGGKPKSSQHKTQPKVAATTSAKRTKHVLERMLNTPSASPTSTSSLSSAGRVSGVGRKGAHTPNSHSASHERLLRASKSNQSNTNGVESSSRGPQTPQSHSGSHSAITTPVRPMNVSRWGHTASLTTPPRRGVGSDAFGSGHSSHVISRSGGLAATSEDEDGQRFTLRAHAPPWSPRSTKWHTSEATGAEPFSQGDNNSTPVKVARRHSRTAGPDGNGRSEAQATSAAVENEFNRMLRKFVHMDSGARRAARKRFAKAAKVHEITRRAKAHAIEMNWRTSVKARIAQAVKDGDLHGLRDVLDEVQATQEARTVHPEFSPSPEVEEEKEDVNAGEKKGEGTMGEVEHHSSPSGERDASASLEDSANYDLVKDRELMDCLAAAEEHIERLRKAPLANVAKVDLGRGAGRRYGMLTMINHHNDVAHTGTANNNGCSSGSAGKGTASVDLAHEHFVRHDDSAIAELLRRSIVAWEFDGVKSIKLHIPLNRTSFVPIAVSIGFHFDTAKPKSLSMLLALDQDVHANGVFDGMRTTHKTETTSAAGTTIQSPAHDSALPNNAAESHNPPACESDTESEAKVAFENPANSSDKSTTASSDPASRGATVSGDTNVQQSGVPTLKTTNPDESAIRSTTAGMIGTPSGSLAGATVSLAALVVRLRVTGDDADIRDPDAPMNKSGRRSRRRRRKSKQQVANHDGSSNEDSRVESSATNALPNNNDRPNRRAPRRKGGWTVAQSNGGFEMLVHCSTNSSSTTAGERGNNGHPNQSLLALWSLPSVTVAADENIDQAQDRLCDTLGSLHATEQTSSPICVHKTSGENHFACVLFAGGARTRSNSNNNNNNNNNNPGEACEQDQSPTRLQHGLLSDVNAGTKAMWVPVAQVLDRRDVSALTKLTCSVLLSDARTRLNTATLGVGGVVSSFTRTTTSSLLRTSDGVNSVKAQRMRFMAANRMCATAPAPTPQVAAGASSRVETSTTQYSPAC